MASGTSPSNKPYTTHPTPFIPTLRLPSNTSTVCITRQHYRKQFSTSTSAFSHRQSIHYAKHWTMINSSVSRRSHQHRYESTYPNPLPPPKDTSDEPASTLDHQQKHETTKGISKIKTSVQSATLAQTSNYSSEQRLQNKTMAQFTPTRLVHSQSHHTTATNINSWHTNTGVPSWYDHSRTKQTSH